MNPVNLDSENALRLKEYLERLGKGEPLESVQKDFREAFGQAAAEDIVKAEQILIHSGTPTSEIEKLCDLHSALFHDQPKPVSIKDMVANKGTIRMKTVQSGGCGSHGHDYDPKMRPKVTLHTILDFLRAGVYIKISIDRDR